MGSSAWLTLSNTLITSVGKNKPMHTFKLSTDIKQRMKGTMRLKGKKCVKCVKWVKWHSVASLDQDHIFCFHLVICYLGTRDCEKGLMDWWARLLISFIVYSAIHHILCILWFLPKLIAPCSFSHFYVVWENTLWLITYCPGSALQLNNFDVLENFIWMDSMGILK